MTKWMVLLACFASLTPIGRVVAQKADGFSVSDDVFVEGKKAGQMTYHRLLNP